ncbi:MAG: anti-sigma factor [Acidimicrobiales bacterium]|nr:anti-sigma factor [Acidimicrobiales bacterium]MYG87815.1 anti-sigma factor [Acidimicrobiales bacterium]MYI27376.1 anti-sigma factor [Acidimicrobiales bacterium]
MSDRPDRRDDTDIEAMLRDLAPEDFELLEPPPAVWEGITSTLGASADPSAADAASADSVVVPFEPRRRRAWRVAVPSAAAAVALVVVGFAVYAVTADEPEVIATASLAYDADAFDPLGAQAQAAAELVADDGRQRILLVDASLPAAGSGADLEAWLIQPDDHGNVADLVSLGLIDPADPGSLAVPLGYDPSLYSVVDISVEPRDGDPAHSGRSILRGVLRTP